jgi:hypothetical protein
MEANADLVAASVFKPDSSQITRPRAVNSPGFPHSRGQLPEQSFDIDEQLNPNVTNP